MRPTTMLSVTPSRDGARRTVSGEPGDFLLLGRIPGWEALGASSHLAVTHQHRPCNSRSASSSLQVVVVVGGPKKGASREGGAARGSISLQEARAKIEDGEGVVSMLKVFH